MAAPLSPSEALAALARSCSPDASDDPRTTNDIVVCIVRLMEKGGDPTLCLDTVFFPVLKPYSYLFPFSYSHPTLRRVICASIGYYWL